MAKIIFASNNAGKIRELQTYFNPLDFTIIPQSELGVADIPETGLTFVENALLKARHAALQTNLPAIADDSGLAVNALHGAPGIYSARYAGPSANNQNNINKLLTDLKAIPLHERTAYFHCILVYLRHAEDPTPLICQGIWEGRILTEPQGQNGFGYDPIFFVPTENKSAAELSIDLKNRISHRGQALQILFNYLTQKSAEI